MAHDPKDISDINEPDNPHTGTIYIVGLISLAFVIGTFAFCAFFNDWMLEKNNDSVKADTVQLEEHRQANAPKLKIIDQAFEAAVKAPFAK